MNRNEGFTLIELLISMSLLSLVLLLGNWSFSLFVSKWQGRLGYFSEHVSQTKDYILLNDIVSSVLPYVIKGRDGPEYYYKSSENRIEAVSKSGIFNTRSPVAFKLSIESLDDGGNYLLYQEVPINDAQLIGSVVYTHEKVLIAKAKKLSFNTFGWNSAYEKSESEDPLIANKHFIPKWSKSYNAKERRLMPIKLQIQWDEESLNINLLNDHGQLLLLISDIK